MVNKNFVWGAATAAAQVEGGYDVFDRTPSIWDVASSFTHSRYIFNGAKTHMTCDHYHHMKEDVKMMKEIGLKAYRFSISWSRLIPSGYGNISKEGVKFYNDLIDELLKNGIEPYITLFHWDYPQVLLEKGGWLNPDSIIWFSEYAKACVKLFSDRVKVFMTLNEPECFVNLGYKSGRHAPYYQLPDEVVFQIQHNVLKANGKAIIEMRKNAHQDIEIGLAFAQHARVPYTNSEEDINAAYRAFFDNSSGSEYWGNWFVNAILTGKYDDMKLINQRIDFVGVNQYTGCFVKNSNDKSYEITDFPANTNYTAMDWPVLNDSLYWTCKMLYDKYKLPIYITENGVAITEWEDLDGKINDDSRIKYISDHLKSVKKAINEGIDIKGYFYWSLLDNFEWSNGNAKRFGLIRVNFETFERKMKKSAYWYRDIIKTNGKEL